MKQTFWLCMTLTRRELSQRYRGTALGMLWPFLYSALLLSLFTFVFSYLLKVRWTTTELSRPSEGALMIFAGLVPFLFLAEVITRAVTCVTAVPNFVKKVRFPLFILPAVVVASSAVIAIVNTLILLVAELVLWHTLPVTVLLLPVLAIPIAFVGIGLAAILSSLGVFFRDLSQASPLITQLLMYLAPVCYPLKIIPAVFLSVIALNPLTEFVNNFRDLTLDGNTISITTFLTETGFAVVFAAVGLAFFHRTRRGFADLL